VGKKEQIIVAIRLNKCDNEELYDELEHMVDRGWGTRSCYLRHLIQLGYEASKEKEREGDQLLEGYDNKLDRLMEVVTELSDKMDSILSQPEGLPVKAEHQEDLEQTGKDDPYSDKEWIANTMRNFCKVK